MEAINYAYNIRGWLTAAKASKFSTELHYNSLPTGLTSTARWNGNIAAQTWQHAGGTAQSYTYSYDAYNRLAQGLLRKMIVYYPMEQDLAHVEEELMKGKSLHESMEGTLLFDSKLRSLTRLGEEVNRQDMVYSRMANQYEQELQQKTELLSSILEPLIILLVGVFVAIILISMYLPMFKLSGAVA